MGPGDMCRRLALPGGVTLKPPNGGSFFCNERRSDFRSSGSFESAAREMMCFGSTAPSCLAQPGAVRARAMISGKRKANSSRSRAAGSRVSRVS